MLQMCCAGCQKPIVKQAKEVTRQRKKKRAPLFFCSNKCAADSGGKHHLKEYLGAGSPKNLIPGNHRDAFTPFRWFLARCRNRAKKHENGMTLECLQQQWANQKGICPYTGWDLLLPDSTEGWKAGRHIRNASLDRIDSSKGYVEGNVQFVAVSINTAKGEFSELEFLELCRAIAAKWRC